MDCTFNIIQPSKDSKKITQFMINKKESKKKCGGNNSWKESE